MRRPRIRRAAALVAVAVGLTVASAVGSPDSRPDVAASAGTTMFEPAGPARLADTRLGTGYAVVGERTIRVEVAGRAEVPTTARAASLTVTVVETTGAGYATVYPAGTNRPDSSNLNFTSGDVRANGAIVTLRDGAVEVYTSVDAHVLVDVNGSFNPAATSRAGRFVPMDPTRRLDTRASAPLGVSGEARLTNQDLGIPQAASAVAVNLTATESAAPGFFTAYPTGSSRPDASVLNVSAAGQTRAAFVIVPTGANGSGINVFSSNGSHLLIDVAGYFTDSSATNSGDGLFVPRSPDRVLDTRHFGPPTWEGHVGTLPGVHGDVLAIAANWTTAEPRGVGYVTAFPMDEWPSPDASFDTSTVNGVPGEAVANLALTRVGHEGVGWYAATGGHVIVDLAGTFTVAPLAPPPTTTTIPPTTTTTTTIPLWDDSMQPVPDPKCITYEDAPRVPDEWGDIYTVFDIDNFLEHCIRPESELIENGSHTAEILPWLNAERAANGRAPVAACPALEEAGRINVLSVTQDMIMTGHNLSGGWPVSYMVHGMIGTPGGENALWAGLNGGQFAFDAWMASPAHRNGINRVSATHVAVNWARYPEPYPGFIPGQRRYVMKMTLLSGGIYPDHLCS